MKKIITILIALTLSFSAFADIKSQETIISEYTALLNDDKATQVEARKNYVAENLESIASIYNTILRAINESSDVYKIEDMDLFWVVRTYTDSIALKQSEGYTFRLATVINGASGQFVWLRYNLTYAELKADAFVCDGWKAFDGNIIRLAELNKDYETFKAYAFVGVNGISLVRSSILAMSDSLAAYEESKFWENLYLEADNAENVEKIQSLQNVLMYRIKTENQTK